MLPSHSSLSLSVVGSLGYGDVLSGFFGSSMQAGGHAGSLSGSVSLNDAYIGISTGRALTASKGVGVSFSSQSTTYGASMLVSVGPSSLEDAFNSVIGATEDPMTELFGGNAALTLGP